MTRLVTLCILALTLPLLSACAVNRRILTRAELECRRADYLEQIAHERTAAIDKIVARWKYEYDEFQAGRIPEQPVFDVLVISGGGDKGAFAAGFLAGWSQVQGPLSRPRFDIVTGVSTGAIIAPYAFTGDSPADARVLKIYREPSKDWSQFRDWFFFLPNRESFFDPAGIKRDIAREINQKVMLDLARGAAEHRILAVGTTNLDLGLSHTWDLTEEAYASLSKHPPSHERVCEILRASAAIPAVFPPVVIDDALHVDGGTTANILIIDDLRAEDGPRHILKKRYPDIPIPKMRFWIVINNRINPEPKVIQPTWVSITANSVDAMIRSSTISALRQFAEQVDYVNLTEHLDIELRYVAIPDSWIPTKEGIFQEVNMRALADIGLAMGLDPKSWRTGLARSLPTQVDTPPECELPVPSPAGDLPNRQ